MKRRTVLATLLVGCAFTGIVLAKPEPTPKETKGRITGEIVHKDGNKITVKGPDGQLTLMPYWRGGMPKDGGGLDKEMVKRLKAFKVGDRVAVTWTFEEHYRIDTIERIEKTE